MPVKKSGLRFLNPMTSINKEYLSFQRASIELIQGVTGEGSISKHRSPSGAQGRKAWRKENSGWCQRSQNQGPCHRSRFRQLTSYNMRQNHRYLVEDVGYYGNWYSIRGYGISWFFMLSRQRKTYMLLSLYWQRVFPSSWQQCITLRIWVWFHFSEFWKSSIFCITH